MYFFFRKAQVCKIIEKFRYLLHFIGEVSCILQIENLMKKFQIEMFFQLKMKQYDYFLLIRYTIQEEESLFSEYKDSWKIEDEFCLQKDNIVFPIKDFKGIRFFFVLKKPSFDVYWFKTKVTLVFQYY